MLLNRIKYCLELVRTLLLPLPIAIRIFLVRQNGSLNLLVFHGGLAPRRVVIYLAERGVTSDNVETIPATISVPGASAEAPGKQPGSVPLLRLEDRRRIHESLANIEYFEDPAEPRGLFTMRSRTPEERARVRELLGFAEEMTLALHIATTHRCVIFASQIESQQSAATVRYMLRHCHKKLSKIEEFVSPGYPFLVCLNSHDTVSQVAVADCVVFATEQHAWEMFGINLTEGHPRLRRLYDTFKSRRSTVVPNGVWPP
jgi:glutathione S-transferase